MSISVQANVMVEQQDADWAMSVIESGQDKTGLLSRLMRSVQLCVQVQSVTKGGQVIQLFAVHPKVLDA